MPEGDLGRTRDLRHARRLSIKVKPESIEEFISIAKTKIFPKIKEQKGARRMYMLRSTQGDGDFVSLTLWDSKEEADEYGNSQAYQENVVMIRDMLENEPVLTEFDIAFHDINADSLPPPEAAKEEVKKEILSSRSKTNRKKTRRKRPKKGRKKK